MKRLALSVCLFLFGVAVAHSARAEANLGFNGVGGRLELVFPDNLDTAFGLGAVFDFGTLAPNVAMGATLDYWSTSEGSADYRDIVIAANSKYVFEITNKKLKPYAGGGLALHFFHVDIPAQTVGIITVPGASDTDMKFGIDFLGGLGYAVSDKVDLTGELMYRVVEDVSQFVISAGAIYWFGK